jgi:hypothetical protein
MQKESTLAHKRLLDRKVDIGIAQPSSKPAAKEMRPRHPVQL